MWHKNDMEILNQKALLRPKSEAYDGNIPFRWGIQMFYEALGDIIAGKKIVLKVNSKKCEQGTVPKNYLLLLSPRTSLNLWSVWIKNNNSADANAPPFGHLVGQDNLPNSIRLKDELWYADDIFQMDDIKSVSMGSKQSKVPTS